MRVINKPDRQPDFFKDWKVQFRRDKGAKAVYADLRGRKEYDMLKEALICEQFHICCYCCNRIDGYSTHIEHFMPRGYKKEGSKKQLDYNNLFASCNGYIQGYSTVDKEFCGHRKDNWYDPNFIISPLDAECERAFDFLPNGEIMASPEGGVKAEKSIIEIGLNSYALIKAREAAIDAAYVEVGFSEEKIDQTKLYDEIEFYSNPNQEGELPAFCDAVSFLLKLL